jgi:hypothetical protein
MLCKSANLMLYPSALMYMQRPSTLLCACLQISTTPTSSTPTTSTVGASMHTPCLLPVYNHLAVPTSCCQSLVSFSRDAQQRTAVTEAFLHPAFLG